MTYRELFEGLMEGKVWTNGKVKVYFNEDLIEDSPWIWQNEIAKFSVGGDHWPILLEDDWHWETPKKTRPMTRDEVLTFVTSMPGIVVSACESEWRPAQYYGFTGELRNYRWAYITKNGIGQLNNFEVEEDG